ncbi:hypothetical protein EON65_17225 [archaeon]|nr:MAG: hypothetical protein EON65_17225 [archaeon]
MDDDSSVTSNQRSVTLKEAIEDNRTPLDFDLKATLITSLLNCNPKDSPSLPTFRITELLVQCTSFDPKKFGEFTTVDSILSLYILCLYFGLSPHIPSPACLACFNSFMVWISECLIVDDELGSKLFVMRNIEDVFHRDDSIDTKYKLDAFHDALGISRQFLRETYALSRDLKQYRSIADETMIPKNPDCVRPSTIYFMLSFALCHIISVLHAQENLSMVPGLVETLVLMLVTTSVDEGKVKGAATDAAVYVKKSNELAAFVCHYVLTPRVLQVRCVCAYTSTHLYQITSSLLNTSYFHTFLRKW